MKRLTIREVIVWQKDVPDEVTEDNAFDWMESNDAWPQSGSWVEDRTFRVEYRVEEVAK